MIEQKLIRVEENDPTRCQAVAFGSGQCPYQAVPGIKYCSRHGGNKAAADGERKRVHDYQLQIWQQRVDEFASSEKVTSLAGEIGILRLHLESIQNMCKDSNDLLIYSTRISDLAMKIDKLITTFDKLQNRSGNLLNKSAALVLAGQIVDIITAHVDDPLKVNLISEGIINLVAALAGKDVEEE